MPSSTVADILVIGGGIAGLGAAARCAPDARVIVLEAEDALGRHATGRSAALFIRNYGNAVLRALNAVAVAEFAAPEDAFGGALLSPRGVLMLAAEDELATAEAYAAGAEGLARLNGAEAASLFPILRPERIALALYEPEAQDIDVDRLLQGYQRMLRARGGRTIPGVEARRLRRAGGVWRVETSAGAFEAPVVVNAAGAWADIVAQRAGLSPLGLIPMRRSAAILPAPEGRDVSGWPLAANAAETWYAKPMGGKLMVSPADEDPVDPHDAWPDDMVLAEGLHRYEQAVTTPVRRVERSWAGLRTFAPDRTPVVGFSPETEGFFWLAGQGGYGVQTAPALSRLAADLCCGRAPALDDSVVEALSPARVNLNATNRS